MCVIVRGGVSVRVAVMVRSDESVDVIVTRFVCDGDIVLVGVGLCVSVGWSVMVVVRDTVAVSVGEAVAMMDGEPDRVGVPDNVCV